MEYTHIRYSDIPKCIDSVSARAGELGDGWSPNELCGGEQSHAYIIKHPIETQWLLAMEYTDIRYSDITTVLILWVPEQHNWRTDGLQMIVWGRAVSCLHNQAPISTQLTSCDGIHWHQVQWHSYVYWFCECQSSTTGGRMVSKWIVWGEQSHAYIIKHPISTQWLLAMEYTDHQVQWHSYVYWFCECQSSTTGGRMVSKWIVWGEQSHAYIIKHPIETQLTSCDGIHSHQVQWHYYVYWFCECQSSTTGGRMVSKWIVWWRAVSCLHNQAPIETQLTPCDGIHSHQVQWHS